MANTKAKSTNPDTSRSTTESAARHHPTKGEHYRCGECGMEIAVNEDCRCQSFESGAHFVCCGRELQRQ